MRDAMAEEKQDVQAQLKQKLKDCFEQYKAEWLQKRPDALIEAAEEIAAVQWMYKELPDAVTDEDAEYLLKFKNPLEVVSDYWTDMFGSCTVVSDEMSRVLWEICYGQGAEADYELEPEFYQPPSPELNMS